mmetsp:Transcript_26880/g.64819  ORF Transcript_26880/g.64819 Transcript_26880/m.64819 type:complete len:102 (+) Transcript_26880:381-686(+)
MPAMRPRTHTEGVACAQPAFSCTGDGSPCAQGTGACRATGHPIKAPRKAGARRGEGTAAVKAREARSCNRRGSFSFMNELGTRQCLGLEVDSTGLGGRLYT